MTEILKGLKQPIGRAARRFKLDSLIVMSNQMEFGDAVSLRYCDAQLMRIILTVQGHKCVTDGWNTKKLSEILVFKLRNGQKCKGCPNTITDPDLINDFDGWCDSCLEHGRNFDEIKQH